MNAEAVELVRTGVEAFNRGDVEWVVGHATPDCEWYPAIVGGVEVEPFRGHQGIREFVGDLRETWQQFGLKVEEIRDLGDHVLVLAQVRAAGKTGVVLEQSLDAVWEIRDGKIAKGRSYLDRQEALNAAAEVAGGAVRE